jgi:hypothetical protein
MSSALLFFFVFDADSNCSKEVTERKIYPGFEQFTLEFGLLIRQDQLIRDACRWLSAHI